jgi:hypothetical protein
VLLTTYFFQVDLNFYFMAAFTNRSYEIERGGSSNAVKIANVASSEFFVASDSRVSLTC